MGEHQIERMTALRQERDNLRAALAWSLSHGTAADGDGAGDRLRMGLRLVAALWFFWYADGAPIEGARWLDALFSRLDGAPREPRSLTLQARALAGASWLAYVRSQSAKAATLANRSLQVLEGDDDAEARANAWTTLGAVALETNDVEGAGTAVSAGPGPRSTSGPRVVDRCVADQPRLPRVPAGRPGGGLAV